MTAASWLDSVSLSLEQEIGNNTYQDITSKKEVVQLHGEHLDRLNSIFSRLVAQSGRRNEVQYSLTVLRDDTINACAAPGGYVFINTGLLRFAQTDGELAGVLGHEIAHVDRRHSMQAIARAVGMTILLQLIMEKSDSKRKKTMAAVSGVALSLMQLGYSREAEYQADQYGVRFMVQAGYNKRDILNFWRRMEAKAGNSKTPGIYTLFSTHPPTSERIKRIEAM